MTHLTQADVMMLLPSTPVIAVERTQELHADLQCPRVKYESIAPVPLNQVQFVWMWESCHETKCRLTSTLGRWDMLFALAQQTIQSHRYLQEVSEYLAVLPAATTRHLIDKRQLACHMSESLMEDDFPGEELFQAWKDALRLTEERLAAQNQRWLTREGQDELFQREHGIDPDQAGPLQLLVYRQGNEVVHSREVLDDRILPGEHLLRALTCGMGERIPPQFALILRQAQIKVILEENPFFMGWSHQSVLDLPENWTPDLMETGLALWKPGEAGCLSDARRAFEAAATLSV